MVLCSIRFAFIAAGRRIPRGDERLRDRFDGIIARKNNRSALAPLPCRKSGLRCGSARGVQYGATVRAGAEQFFSRAAAN